ncbi:MAG: DUF211 domain-containing protein [Proteobacteria bacterium]|nr:DUF211 domain-containing protein [Pseudomonadota bacterium]
MELVKRLLLDVLKPHSPNPLEFARNLASLSEGYEVRLVVEEMDEKTESIILEISAHDIDYDLVSEKIKEMGGSIHSIDEVEVVNAPAGE